MKTLKSLFWIAAMGGLTLAACGGDDSNTGDGVDAPRVDAATGDGDVGPQTIRVDDDITTNTTWVATNTYILPRLKYVFVQPGATLTIEPGTVIKGEQGAVLVVTRGGKIDAVGTADKPIVFTSAQAVGSRTPGFWGGLLVLGAAPMNINTLSTPPSNEATFEAFTSSIPEGKFGGDNAADNSGKIKYVRIEFGGFNFVADREFNNLTLCGVGSGTEIDYVQVHRGKDDGVEFFGGTVNVKHLLSTQNEDDGFDTDNGWQGKGQFVVIQDVKPDASREASNGYESDNHGTAASYVATPRTLPTIYNVTMLGSADYATGPSFAAVFRRGTGGHYFNHLIMNYPAGVEFRDAATQAQLDAGNLYMKNSILFNNDALGNDDNWPPAQATGDIDEAAYFTNATWANRFVDPGMSSAAFSLESPNFKVADGSPALTGGATPPSAGFFDATARYVGAVGPVDRTAGWTAYPQN